MDCTIFVSPFRIWMISKLEPQKDVGLYFTQMLTREKKKRTVVAYFVVFEILHPPYPLFFFFQRQVYHEKHEMNSLVSVVIFLCKSVRMVNFLYRNASTSVKHRRLGPSTHWVFF